MRILKNSTLSFRTFSFLLMMSLSSTLLAQGVNRKFVPVEENGQILEFAWAGGLNAPQFSEIDFNGDGIKDLYVFDRLGNAQLTFLNGGTPGQIDYQFTPAYAGYFPKMTNWVLLRDYNGDGLEDIFCHSQVPGVDGFSVYTTQKSGNDFNFIPYQFDFTPNIMPFDLGGGNYTNLYVAFTDYPAMVDIENDGDLDILTFDLAGSVVYWYKNISVEEGYGQDSLLYILEDDCWGDFKESGMSSEVILSDDADECAEGLQSGGGGVRHAGSTLLALDMDNDEDMELVLGDLFSYNLVMLTNEGSVQNAWMTGQDVAFPSTDTPVDLPVFNASFYLDVNNDGKKDFLAAPNSINLIEDVEGVWLYNNAGTADEPDFQFEKTDFLVEGMVDLGTGANPAFADINGDGLTDLVVGNFSYYQPGGQKDSRLALFLNTGTTSAPAFELQNDDWLGFSAFSGAAYDFAPTFGDIDMDGDLDLLIGEQQGSLFLLENTAGVGNPMAFGPPQYPYQNIDKGQSTTPQIIDLNRDGKMDIVLGERSGFLTYFENIGTAQAPAFNPDADIAPNINKLGGVDTRGADPTQGYSAPFLVDFDGEYMLFSGSLDGGIRRYTNIDGNLDGDFTEETKEFGGVREGARTYLSMTDLDNDGLLDMVVGNFRGGIGLFGTSYLSDGTVAVGQPGQTEEHFRLYPNPAKGQVMLELADLGANLEEAELEIRDALGRIAFRYAPSQSITQLDLSTLSPGMYWVSLKQNGLTRETRKLILR
jgi:hypothetical protein